MRPCAGRPPGPGACSGGGSWASSLPHLSMGPSLALSRTWWGGPGPTCSCGASPRGSPTRCPSPRRACQPASTMTPRGGSPSPVATPPGTSAGWATPPSTSRLSRASWGGGRGLASTPGALAASLAPVSGALLVAVSRVMDYRHNPSDVLAGSLLGLLCAWAFFRQQLGGPLARERAHVLRREMAEDRGEGEGEEDPLARSQPMGVL